MIDESFLKTLNRFFLFHFVIHFLVFCTTFLSPETAYSSYNGFYPCNMNSEKCSQCTHIFILLLIWFIWIIFNKKMYCGLRLSDAAKKTKSVARNCVACCWYIFYINIYVHYKFVLARYALFLQLRSLSVPESIRLWYKEKSNSSLNLFLRVTGV